MKHIFLTRIALYATLPVGIITPLCAATEKSDTSSEPPYVLPAHSSTLIRSLMTTGDAVNYKAHTAIPYRMAGTPDGLGAFDNDGPGANVEDRGTFTLLMAHEFQPTAGIPRDHGLAGSFISKWIIDKKTLKVIKGEDLIKTVHVWDNATQSYVPATAGFTRFCSGDLPALSAFYNKKTGLGYKGRIFMNGEETSNVGRAFAHFMDGNSFELPALGKFAWENAVANPATGNKTIVAGTDDGTGGQVYIFAGDKAASPDSLVAAGLNTGILYGIKLNGVSVENDATSFSSGAFTTVSLGNVKGLTGPELESASQAAGVTSFARPEDSCWDPSNPNDLYFCTTASFSGISRLWKLSFSDASRPDLGGTATVILDSSRGPKMMDNLTISPNGTILIQEDIGSQAPLGKIWRYSIKTGALDQVAAFDPVLFDPAITGNSEFLTSDEEASGIIPMDDILGEGWFLFDAQAHYAQPGELVEGGQLLAMKLPTETKQVRRSPRSLLDMRNLSLKP